jgi:hypothetical protein
VQDSVDEASSSSSSSSRSSVGIEARGRRYAYVRDERIVAAAFDVVALLGARAAAARQTQLLLVDDC